MLSCSTGGYHSVVLSRSGIVHSFGRNDKGQLGLGTNQTFNVPQQIQTLKNIIQISCGELFTICVDRLGKLWGFGANDFGQLGIGNNANQTLPQEVLGIPPISNVSCGFNHTLCITQSQELWSFGNNEYHQLCLVDKEAVPFLPNQTEFNDIVSISAGCQYSMFQTKNGDIYSCGTASDGPFGTCFNSTKQPTPIELPSKICQFSCGYSHAIFLDEEGTVYGWGKGTGIGSSDQTILNKILNLPKIKFIATLYRCSIFIDEDNYCWSLGYGGYGQLGNGNSSSSSTPIKIPGLENITNVSSSGSYSYHVIATDKTGQMYSFGNNGDGQLGVNDNSCKSSPTKLDAKYSQILKPFKEKLGEFESLSKIMKWDSNQKQQMIKLNSHIASEKYKIESNNEQFQKKNQSKPFNSFETWKQADQQLNAFIQDSKTQLNSSKQEKQKIENELKALELELNALKQKIKVIEAEMPKKFEMLKQMECYIDGFDNDFNVLEQMKENTSFFSENENVIECDLKTLFDQKSIEEFDVEESSLVLWEMGLPHFQSIFEKEKIEFSSLCESSDFDTSELLEKVGFNQRDICCLLFFKDYLSKVGYLTPNEMNKLQNEDEDKEKYRCAVCEHNTPEETILLLKEYDIKLDDIDIIVRENWSVPLLLHAKLSTFGLKLTTPEGKSFIRKMSDLNQIHQSHLKQLPNYSSKSSLGKRKNLDASILSPKKIPKKQDEPREDIEMFLSSKFPTDIKGKRFCVTTRGNVTHSKIEIKQAIDKGEGFCSNRLTKQTDFLICDPEFEGNKRAIASCKIANITVATEDILTNFY